MIIGMDSGRNAGSSRIWDFDPPDEDCIGAILMVQLVNFMCHKNLQIKLCPKINFIVGPNGSGKSAILTAISICLGGTSTFTNRASSLKEFLSRGASTGAVTIILSNKGKDAYKPELYGDAVVIQRLISSDNTSSYVIRSENDVVISRKRDDVMAICDHMQICPKNPLAILTQEKARSFLATSSPQEKYKFFLAGTRLSELNYEYQVVKASLETQKNVAKIQEQNLESVKKSLKELEENWKYLQATNTLQSQLITLKNMLGWAMVYAQEKKYQSKDEQMNKISRRVMQLKESLEENKKLLDDNLTAGKVNQDKMALLLSKAEPLKQERDVLVKNLKQIHQKLQVQKTEAKTMLSTLEVHNNTKNFLCKKLDDEKKRVEYITSFADGKTDIKRTLADLNSKKNRLESERIDLCSKEAIKIDSCTKYEEKLENIKQEISDYAQELNKREYKLNELHNRQKNKYHVFGSSMNEAIKMIESYTNEGRWKGNPPLGPLGSYVKVLNKKFIQLVGELLGPSLNAFAVETHEDLVCLRSIFERTQCQYKIWKYDTKNVDYSSGEPSQDYNTLIRVIEISNPVLLGQLVVNHHIERIVITESHTEAIEIVKNGFPKNVHGVFSSDCRSFGNRIGGLATQAMPLSNKPPKLIEDMDGYIQIEKKGVDSCKLKIQSLRELVNEYEETLNVQSNERNDIREKLVSIDLDLEEVRNDIQRLEDSISDVQTGAIISLTEAIAAEEETIKNIANQQRNLTRDRSIASAEEHSLTSNIKQLDNQLMEMRKEHDDVASAITTLMAEELKLKNENAHRTEQLSKYLQKLSDIENDVRLEKKTFELEYEKCLRLCDKMEVVSTPEELESEIKTVECKIKSLENEYGNYEAVGLELSSKNKMYKQAKDDLDMMLSFLDDISRTLILRTKQWIKFRNYFSSRAKQIYSFLMKKRGYRGRMHLNHDEGTLRLVMEPFKIVKTVPAKRKLHTLNSQDKDPRALSGGERSFSTICLLISLWEGMACPFRALDEFDVFMDPVNRRQSMQLILDNYKEAGRSVQHIFITPQSLSYIHRADYANFKIHLLSDPERSKNSQAALAG